MRRSAVNRQINYKTMRVIVGGIAILLAPVTWLLADAAKPVTSISITYWSNSGDIFVGAMIAVSFFLCAYNGTEGKKDPEFFLSKAASLFAAGVAFFPAEGFFDTDIAPSWTRAFAGFFGLKTTWVHYGSAILLFVCLIGMMWYFSKRASLKGRIRRAWTYRIISILMVAGMVGIFLIGSMTGYFRTMLLVEIWGLTLFGIGWLIAGAYKSESIK